jgi:hypothetical protein
MKTPGAASYGSDIQGIGIAGRRRRRRPARAAPAALARRTSACSKVRGSAGRRSQHPAYGVRCPARSHLPAGGSGFRQ